MYRNFAFMIAQTHQTASIVALQVKVKKTQRAQDNGMIAPSRFAMLSAPASKVIRNATKA
jgi:hypothetical protein